MHQLMFEFSAEPASAASRSDAADLAHQTESRADATEAIELRDPVAAAVPTSAQEHPAPAPHDTQPSATNLADALDRFLANQCMTKHGARDARSAVSRLSRLAGRDASQIEMSADTLQRLFATLQPAKQRLSPQSWSNVKSVIRRIATFNGTIDASRPPGERLLPAWEHLNRSVADLPAGVMLGPFVTFCSRQGIGPEMVRDETVTDYLDWRSRRTLNKPHLPLRAAIVRIWNKLASTMPEWPSHQLQAAKKRLSQDQQLLAVPESFRCELDRYIARLNGTAGSPFDLDLTNCHLSPATIRSRRSSLVRAVSAALAAGVEPNQIRSLADLVGRRMFVLIFEHLHCEDGGQKQWRASRATLASHLVSLARDIGASDADVAELRRLAGRVRGRKRPGLPEKIDGRIAAVMSNPSTLHRLYTLRFELEGEARKMLATRPVHAAELHETAVMLAILSYNPIRRRNLATLHLDRHFVRDGSGRIVAMHISGRETKNGIPNDWDIPTDVGALISRHVATFRPKLRGAESSNWLFPSPTPGQHRDPASVSRRFTAIIRRRLGIEVHMHLMRHLAATLLYDADPKNGPIVQRIEGHSELKGTERMYGVRRNSSSLRKWGSVLDDKIARLAARAGRER